MKNVPSSHLAILFVAALIGALLLGGALYRTAQQKVLLAIAPEFIEKRNRGR